MKYAHIDENNMLLGYYDDQLHATIPTPNIALSDQEWQACVDANVNKVNADGTGEIVDTRTAEEIANEYKIQRRAAYPSIGDQLDMIYRAGLGGDEFQAAIAAVKAEYPKP